MAFASPEDYYRSERKFLAKFIQVLWAITHKERQNVFETLVQSIATGHEVTVVKMPNILGFIFSFGLLSLIIFKLFKPEF